ncbi:unnamed protein product [Cercopithifilaria johnstoni]|uniref:DOMON domain-containing protein n=1 Tax=Cercopithifilaria johnstoni TaxID=2874296 RepID=A0A8J2M1X5_9BILA|nr:unnamed protein product [Cercopithifilaria johnstoni]
MLPLLNGAGMRRSSCGTLHGCWSVPNECNSNECTANLRWSVSGRGSFLRLRLEALLRDLPSYAMYIALGFSNDQLMGDDTVIECVYNGVDEGKAYVSYNDGNYNVRLHEASAILIVNSSFIVNDDTFTCLLNVDFKQLYRLSDDEQLKKMHSLSDGSLYPWITTTMISMLRNKDGKYENVKNARQVKWFSRTTTHAMVTLHVILMIWSWWFLLSNAILLSRHFKTLWATIQIADMPIWFQVYIS